MQLRNTLERFGWPVIMLHWLMAALVIGLFSLGLWMVELDYYNEWYTRTPYLHKSIGVCVFVLLIVRVCWRFTNVQPTPFATGLVQRLGSAAHITLYVLLAVTTTTGYLILTADGRPVDVFGVIAIPASITSLPDQEDLAGLWHWYLALCLVVLAGVHALAAFWHHLVLHDATLRRMLGRK